MRGNSFWWMGALGLAMAAALWLHEFRWRNYSFQKDDFFFLEKSASWTRLQTHLWDLHAQHCCPWFRTVTTALLALCRELPDWPAVLRLGPLLALILTMLSLAWVGRLLTGLRACAAVAAGLFGITSVHASIVQWYCASQAAWATAFCWLAVGLLVRFVQGAGVSYGLLAFVCSYLAGGWWSTGLVAGPLSWVVVVSTGCFWSCERSRRRLLLASILAWASPILWVVTVRLALWPNPLPTDELGRPFLQAFRPHVAAFFACRTVAERLLLNNLGVSQPDLPAVTGFCYGLAVLVLMLWVWRCWRLITPLVIGAWAAIVMGYLLPYSFRSRVEFVYLRANDWYNCLPQAGLALFLAGLVERFYRRSPKELTTQRNAARRPAVLALLFATTCAFQFLTHRPLATAKGKAMLHERQRSQLAELELVERFCWQLGVSEAQLRRVMPRYEISGGDLFDGLRLVELPQQETTPWAPELLRKLLQECLETGRVPRPGSGSPWRAATRPSMVRAVCRRPLQL
jgi:hypothetical protein